MIIYYHILDPSFQSSSGVKTSSRKITNEEIAIDEEEAIKKEVELWKKDLCDLPPISHKEIYGMHI